MVSPTLVLRICVALLLVLAATLYAHMPEPRWAAIAPGIVVGALQLAVGLVITDMLMVRVRRERVRQVAHSPITHALTSLQFRLMLLLEGLELENLRRRLDEGQRDFARAAEDLAEYQVQHGSFLDFETATQIQALRSDVERLSRICDFNDRIRDNDDDRRRLVDLVWSVEQVRPAVATLSKQFGAKWSRDRETKISKAVRRLKQTHRIF